MPLKGSETKGYLLLGRKAVTNLDSILKSRDITLLTNVCLVKAVVFPVVMLIWELDYKESWGLKNWCFWIVVLEKTLESPLDCKEIQPVHPKEISPEYSLEGLMLKLKLQYFGYLMWRIESLEKTLMLEKTEGRRRRGQEDEMVGWHHRLNGHEFEQALGVCDGQGGLVCCSPWVHKELDTTERLNWTDYAISMEERKRKSVVKRNEIVVFLEPLVSK